MADFHDCRENWITLNVALALKITCYCQLVLPGMTLQKALKFIPLAVLLSFCFNRSPAKARELHPEAAIQLMYAAVASLHGQQVVPRTYRPISAGTPTACGRMEPYNAIYCPKDHSIYLSIGMVRQAYQYGDAAIAYIVAHEYAHAMQTVYGFSSGITAINELQADCLAGVYMAVTPNVVFDSRDILEIQRFASSIGDLNFWSQQHHGTPQQRVAAVTRGLSIGHSSACF